MLSSFLASHGLVGTHSTGAGRGRFSPGAFTGSSGKGWHPPGGEGTVGGGWLPHCWIEDQNRFCFGKCLLKIKTSEHLKITFSAYQGRQTGHPFAGTCSIKFWREDTGIGDNANWLPRNLECRGRFT